MSLFDAMAEVNRKKAEPLASRMRPRTLDEYVGQEHIIGEGKLLRRAIIADRLSSLIFYGPAGTGKTSLAKVIANTTSSDFKQLSAVTSGIADIRKVLETAKDNLDLYNMRTVLFIDEIHRFNKGQQDALLPAVEDGTVILIGATTENPYFEVNSALLSRSRIFQLYPLNRDNVRTLLLQAVKDKERGLGNYNVDLQEAALEHLVESCGGDARTALNALELAVLTTAPNDNGIREITADIAADSIQRKVLHYDKKGDNHYDVISAFIKSMRGSDADAALHYLARMIAAGESPEFIVRRVIICAAEDVGLADPKALQVAVSAMEAVRFVGWPEARIPIAMAVVYIANAPKSNTAYMGIDNALADLKNLGDFQVPNHLRDSHYPGAEKLGHGLGYKYVHNYPGGWVEQDYLPKELLGKKYYIPSGIGEDIGKKFSVPPAVDDKKKRENK
jgi:putative ATPase